MFDGTLGYFHTDPVKSNLQLGAKPYHTKLYPMPQSQKAVFKKEVEQLCQIGVLKRQPESEWSSPAFNIPKLNQTVPFLTDFRQVNKCIIRTYFPLTKSSTILQKMEGFIYATAIDLKMGYCTIKLDSDA